MSQVPVVERLNARAVPMTAEECATLAEGRARVVELEGGADDEILAACASPATAGSPASVGRINKDDHGCRRRGGLTWLVAYLVAQTLLTAGLKASVMFAGWYWPGMVGGIGMAMVTTWLFMRVFAFFPAHLAQALGVGISFVLGQMAIAALMQSWPSVLQIIGIVAIFSGVFLISEPSRAREGDSRC